MTSIRKTWWSALALSLPLAFVAGCGEPTEPTAETPGTTPTTSTPAPSAPAPTKPSEPSVPAATPEAKVETPKTDAPKVEAPKIDAPKVEGPKVDAPKTDAPKADAPKGDAPKAAAAVKLTDEELAEIKKLPAGEVDAALKQAVCPVSDEHLGGMGTPIKVTAEGKTFYICCKGCKEDVEKDAKKVLAKLAK